MSKKQVRLGPKCKFVSKNNQRGPREERKFELCKDPTLPHNRLKCVLFCHWEKERKILPLLNSGESGSWFNNKVVSDNFADIFENTRVSMAFRAT